MTQEILHLFYIRMLFYLDIITQISIKINGFTHAESLFRKEALCETMSGAPVSLYMLLTG